jgi:myosin heavy subunit
MSEADLRAHQHQPHPAVPSDTEPLQSNFAAAGGFEPIAPHPTDTPARVPQQPEKDWQTVDFPNAISVDAIPTKPETKNSQSQTQPTEEGSPPISDNLKNLLGNTEQAKGKGATPVTLMQALHECNRDLLQRLAQLETALEESQNTLQNRETLLEQRTAELENTQEQLTRLFGKVEVSHQTLQSQEILVESLRSNLATSQARLAAVERECASTVQRYNEQLHQLVATENICRELRSRLHRQQRHTLQFKAALERSLEMPHIKPPIVDPPDNVDDTATAQLESLLATVKSSQVPVPPAFNASPVKPWSEPAEHSEAAAASDAIDPESIANQELNKLAQVSGIQLHPTEINQPQEPATDSALAVAEPQLQVAESEPETAAVKSGSPELVSAVQILNSVESFGIQEVRSSAAKSTAVTQPDWLALIASPLRPSKKRRSLAEIELPSFR